MCLFIGMCRRLYAVPHATRLSDAALTWHTLRRYAQQTCARLWNLLPHMPRDAVTSCLPRTRAWLAAASTQLPHAENALMPLGPPHEARNGPSPATRVQPVDMRAGRAAGQLLGSGMPAAIPVEDAWQPLPSAAPLSSVRSWQGLLRLGLLHAAAASAPVDPAATAETLACDLGRLRAAQTAFQQLVVLAACSLLLHRTAAARGRVLAPGDLLAV